MSPSLVSICVLKWSDRHHLHNLLLFSAHFPLLAGVSGQSLLSVPRASFLLASPSLATSQWQLTLPLGPAGGYSVVVPRLWGVLVGGEGDWGSPCSGKWSASSWTWSGTGHLPGPTWSPCLVQVEHHCHDSRGAVPLGADIEIHRSGGFDQAPTVKLLL